MCHISASQHRPGPILCHSDISYRVYLSILNLMKMQHCCDICLFVLLKAITQCVAVLVILLPLKFAPLVLRSTRLSCTVLEDVEENLFFIMKDWYIEENGFSYRTSLSLQLTRESMFYLQKKRSFYKQKVCRYVTEQTSVTIIEVRLSTAGVSCKYNSHFEKKWSI